MKAKATSLGMSVTYQGSPNFAPAAQTPIVDAICTKHPNVLIVSPTDPVAMAPAIDTCLNAGIPVITVDTGLSNTSKLTSAITTDNDSGGKAAADYVGKALGGKGQVALMSLSPTATTQVERISRSRRRSRPLTRASRSSRSSTRRRRRATARPSRARSWPRTPASRPSSAAPSRTRKASPPRSRRSA